MISQKWIKDTIERLSGHKGVKGVVITSSEGIPLSSTLSSDETEKIAAFVTSIVDKAKKIINELGTGKLNFLTVDASKKELLIAPEKDYILVVLR